MEWKSMPMSHKIATVVSSLAFLVLLVSDFKPELFPVNPVIPALAVFGACEALIFWKEKRKWSYVIMGAVAIAIVLHIVFA